MAAWTSIQASKQERTCAGGPASVMDAWTSIVGLTGSSRVAQRWHTALSAATVLGAVGGPRAAAPGATEPHVGGLKI